MIKRTTITRRSWLAIGLLASLAVNAFFIGAAATDVLNSQPVSDRGSSLLKYEVRWLKTLLPEDAMAEVKAAFDSGRPEVNLHLEQLRQLRADLGGLVAAPEPDVKAIDAQLVRIRAEIGAMLADTQELTTGALLALPLEDRAALAPMPATN